MAPFGTSYNPADVMMGGSGGGPYMWTGTNKPGTLGPEAIRATGKGPFDPAYRQNLATYAGGQFARPTGGGMAFNPTDMSTFPGQATGGGTAPVTGMPQTLSDLAFGGQGFSWNQPTPTPSTGTQAPDYQSLQDWLDEFLKNGRGFRTGEANA